MQTSKTVLTCPAPVASIRWMGQEGKERLPGPFILCLSGFSEPPSLFYPQEPCDNESRAASDKGNLARNRAAVSKSIYKMKGFIRNQSVTMVKP
jgi:hypothetical protein